MEKMNLSNFNLKYESDLDCEGCAKSTGGKQNLKQKFTQLHCDSETEEFIANCFQSKYQLFKASYIRSLITLFYTQTEANAILGTGKMFMFSKSQLEILFDGFKFENMLDIGAGDGYITKQFREIVREEIVCTEYSQKMISVLAKSGYKIQQEIEGSFDLIACLNVLDRCDRPLTILKKIQNIKKNKVLISIVLPYRGFYYNNSSKKQSPQLETLIDYYKNWEENVNILAKTFRELGFNVDKISRVPYLSEGTFRKRLYTLDTAVFVLS